MRIAVYNRLRPRAQAAAPRDRKNKVDGAQIILNPMVGGGVGPEHFLADTDEDGLSEVDLQQLDVGWHTIRVIPPHASTWPAGPNTAENIPNRPARVYNHSGRGSQWGRQRNLGERSIGIEISCIDHENYNAAQMSSLINLLGELTATYGVASDRIIGHCDIVNFYNRRANCPGIQFPWPQMERATADNGQGPFGLSRGQGTVLPNLPGGARFLGGFFTRSRTERCGTGIRITLARMIADGSAERSAIEISLMEHQFATFTNGSETSAST